MRTGRITAFHFKSVSRTSPVTPSISLIMYIFHPEISRFQTAATQWGCEHEKIARDDYTNLLSLNHENFRVDECGFFISTEYPFVGATPDGLVACGCCGDGICEIKVYMSVVTELVGIPGGRTYLRPLTLINSLICSALIVIKKMTWKRQSKTPTCA